MGLDDFIEDDGGSTNNSSSDSSSNDDDDDKTTIEVNGEVKEVHGETRGPHFGKDVDEEDTAECPTCHTQQPRKINEYDGHALWYYVCRDDDCETNTFIKAWDRTQEVTKEGSDIDLDDIGVKERADIRAGHPASKAVEGHEGSPGELDEREGTYDIDGNDTSETDLEEERRKMNELEEEDSEAYVEMGETDLEDWEDFVDDEIEGSEEDDDDDFLEGWEEETDDEEMF